MEILYRRFAVVTVMFVAMGIVLANVIIDTRRENPDRPYRSGFIGTDLQSKSMQLSSEKSSKSLLLPKSWPAHECLPVQKRIGEVHCALPVQLPARSVYS